MDRPKLLRALLLVLNFALVIFTGALLYLLFGDNLVDAYRNRPSPLERTVFRPGAGGSSGRDAAAETVVAGIHQPTGLVYATGFDIVRGTCTACHSAQLITQNRATREGWEEMIRWMQAKQGLWDLGKNEDAILDYLATHYAPQSVGRRPNLDVEAIEWYILETAEN